MGIEIHKINKTNSQKLILWQNIQKKQVKK